jgi:hypothetical protein
MSIIRRLAHSDSPASLVIAWAGLASGVASGGSSVGDALRAATAALQAFCCHFDNQRMELGGLEPPTSWVRSRRSPN